MTPTPLSSGRQEIEELIAGASGAFLWSVPDARLYGDARFADLYGLSRDAVAEGSDTHAFFARIHPDDRMRIRIAVAGVMHGADLFEKTFRLLRETGDVIWVAVKGRAERDASGGAVRFGGVVVDVTEQKRLEERLRLAQAAGGVGTFEYVSGFGTVEVSDAFCRLLGLTPTDALALRAINATLAPGSPAIIPEPGQADAAEQRECEIIRPDNGERRWIACRGEYRNDGPGGAPRFIGAIHDITQTKTVERQLRELTAALEQRVGERTRERDRVWNNSRDLVAILGPDGAVRAASPAWMRLLGYSAERVEGTRHFDLIHPDDLEASKSAGRRAMAGENLVDFENRYRHRDGSLRWITWHTYAEEDLVYAYGRDITDEKARAATFARTEDQLRQAQKMEAVGQLTGGLAHDFNNMLTGIIGGLDIVRRRIAAGRLNEIDRFMDGAVQSAQRAAGLTHRLLAFSRQQPLDPRPVDVAALTRSMEDLLTRTLGEQVRLEVTTPGDLWLAVCDVNQLESALLNLAINARDAMPNGGSLSVACSNRFLEDRLVGLEGQVAAGDYVEIAVADTGDGMTDEVRAKVFEPFFTTKPIGQGTGLGLSMIYGFVRQSGGHVEIDSAVGEGTTIRLFLPRAKDPVADASDVETAPTPPGEGETVLVVEDEASVRALVVEVLDELGYRPLEAQNSDEAMALVRTRPDIALLVTDVGLPRINGRQLAEMARAQRPDLSILFVTGYAANATVRSSFLGDGMDMINKPFAVDDLAAKVRAMIGETKASRIED